MVANQRPKTREVRMLLNGQWCRDSDFASEVLQMKLGDFFLAEVKPGSGDLAGYWVVILNGKTIGAHKDKEWAMGCAEQEICKRLHNIRHDFLVIKKRAPTASDLYGDGA